MDTSDLPPLSLSVHPLTPDRWADLERLFGQRGACGGCWCMWWRLTRSEFEKRKGESNRQAFRAIVESGPAPGLLAYDGTEPIAWCAVEPRSRYPALQRSRTLKPLDDEPVWSITCFFVTRSYRRRGVSVRLLQAAVEHVGRQGGRILEGYPNRPTKGNLPDVFAWTGLVRSFERAGFTERARPSASRAIMRYEIAEQEPV